MGKEKNAAQAKDANAKRQIKKADGSVNNGADLVNKAEKDRENLIKDRETREAQALAIRKAAVQLPDSATMEELLAAEQAVKAESLGLKSDSTAEEIATAQFEADNKLRDEQAAKNADFKDNNQKLFVLAEFIDKVFTDRAKTSLPGITETELRTSVRHLSGLVEVTYTNEDKTKGFVTVSENADVKKRLPEEGEYTFGVDYHAVAKAMSETNQA